MLIISNLPTNGIVLKRVNFQRKRYPGFYFVHALDYVNGYQHSKSIILPVIEFNIERWGTECKSAQFGLN